MCLGIALCNESIRSDRDNVLLANLDMFVCFMSEYVQRSLVSEKIISNARIGVENLSNPEHHEISVFRFL